MSQTFDTNRLHIEKASPLSFKKRLLQDHLEYKHWLYKIDHHFQKQQIYLQNIKINDSEEIINSTQTIDNNTILFTNCNIKLLIILKVENIDYTLLISQTRLATGYPNFIELPDPFNILDILLEIGIDTNLKQFTPLPLSHLFYQNNPKYLVKNHNSNWNWFTNKTNLNLNKHVDGWFPSPQNLTQSTRFLSFTKPLNYPDFQKIIDQIENYNNQNHKIKLIVVPLENAIHYSPDMHTTTAILLHHLSHHHITYFEDRTHLYYILFFSIIITGLIIFYNF